MSIGIGHNQIQIVKDHKPQLRIAVNKNDATNFLTADWLQDFLPLISVKLPTVNVGLPTQPGDVVIGSGDVSGLTEDGFRIQTQNGCLYISSGGDKGTIYSFVTLLWNTIWEFVTMLYPPSFDTKK